MWLWGYFWSIWKGFHGYNILLTIINVYKYSSIIAITLSERLSILSNRTFTKYQVNNTWDVPLLPTVALMLIMITLFMKHKVTSKISEVILSISIQCILNIKNKCLTNTLLQLSQSPNTIIGVISIKRTVTKYSVNTTLIVLSCHDWSVSSSPVQGRNSKLTN